MIRDVRKSMFKLVDGRHSIEISDLSIAEMIATVFSKKSVEQYLESFQNHDLSLYDLNHVLRSNWTANFYLQCTEEKCAYATFTSRNYIGLYSSALHSVEYIMYEGNLPMYGLVDIMMPVDEIHSQVAISVPHYVYWDANTSGWLVGFDNEADYMEYTLTL